MAPLNGTWSVLDCHHHVGEHGGALLPSGGALPGGEDHADGGSAELEARLAGMAADGIDQAIVMPDHSYLRPCGNADTMEINDSVARYREQAPDRFVAAFGIAEPLHGSASIDELHRIKGELGLAGVSFHARYQGAATNSRYVVDLVREIASLGMLPAVHSLGVVSDEAWWKVQDLADAISGSPLLVLDGFTTSEHAREAARVAKQSPNIHFELGSMVSLQWVKPMLEAAGPERVVFGTNTNSSSTFTASRPSALKAILAIDGIDDGAKQLLLGGNIRRLIGVD